MKIDTSHFFKLGPINKITYITRIKIMCACFFSFRDPDPDPDPTLAKISRHRLSQLRGSTRHCPGAEFNSLSPPPGLDPLRHREHRLPKNEENFFLAQRPVRIK